MTKHSYKAKVEHSKYNNARFSWLISFYVGRAEDVFSEDIRRVFVINLFASVGVLFTLPLGIGSLIEGKFVLGSLLLFVALLYAINHIYLRRTHNHNLSGKFVIYPLYVLMIYLMYTGGAKGTGHVWVFCVPAVSLFLHGMKRGMIELGIFTLALIVTMFFMNSHFTEFGYDPMLKSRIIFSFILVVFLSWIYEYSMSRFNQELKETSAKLKLVAYTDSLTELLNRRGMLQRLEASTYRSFHLILADVDFFKSINDEYGHDAGDYALIELSKIIQTSLSEGHLASRWGGEEFLIAVCDCSESQAIALAESIRQRVAEYEFVYLDQKFRMTMSFGVATMNEMISLREAITLADNHLYSAKRAGRNQTRSS
ncbi:GGDEF domain-containing protein [Marinomonas rhizomae]|uniref:diguanylate cyclase n=1 Tax=Marinomonas rhizomae TaxID=491948 RepID=A0A366J0X0_9GAMM|nr:GGDEF domain-containing protein [Marinomonas rhizomae]RBP79989.1 diguanylate cyclase (GGDEF)-like protein [Marinomonas rhizomae]RNF71920.1 GGDEF domain-containing protein [Marinomonas rhizomae]